MVQKNRKI